MLFDTFPPTLLRIFIFPPNTEFQNQSQRTVFQRYIPWHRNMKKGMQDAKPGLGDPYQRFPLPNSTHALQDQRGRGTQFTAQGAAQMGRAEFGLRQPARLWTSGLQHHEHRGLCTEYSLWKLCCPTSEPSRSSSRSVQKPPARRDPAGHTFLPLRPRLRVALGWWLNSFVHHISFPKHTIWTGILMCITSHNL